MVGDSCPTAFLSGINPWNSFSRRSWLNDNDLFSANGTDGIHQILHPDHSRSIDRPTSMQPAIPTLVFRLVIHIKQDHWIILVVGSNDFPVSNILGFWKSVVFTVGRTNLNGVMQIKYYI